MLYVVRFTDKPASADLRKQRLPAHLCWLDANQDSVLVAGSLRSDPAKEAMGGLWIVEASSREAVEALIPTDPFWTEGLREGYEIHHWSKAFPERKALV